MNQYTLTLCELEMLGAGKTAAVYALDEQRVLKLYFDGCPLFDVEAEYACGGLAYRNGVPTPRMIELCSVNGRYALIMERIDGQSMLQPLFAAGPGGFEELTRSFAQIHRSMLGIHAPDAPDIKQRLSYRLEACGCARLLPRLDRLPDGEMLCHGDFHPDNVLLCGRKPYVIDFMSCCKGAPILDIARTYYLMSYGARGLIDDALHQAIGAQYLGAMGMQKEELADALPVTMAVRLCEKPSELEREVIDGYLSDVRI